MSRDESFRDTVMGAVGFLGLAALLSPVLWWLLRASGALVEDADRAGKTPGGQALVEWGVGIWFITAVVGVVVAGSVGTAVWMVVRGAIRRRGGGGLGG